MGKKEMNFSADWWSNNPDNDKHQITDTEEFELWSKKLRELLPSEASHVIDMDTGSGNGVLTYLLGKFGYQVTGIDISPPNLHKAILRCNSLPNRPTFAIGDAASPPFSFGAADIIVNRLLLWTLPEGAFQNWFKILKSGGELCCIDGLWFNKSRLKNEPEVAKWRKKYTEEIGFTPRLMYANDYSIVETAFKSAGFEKIKFSKLEKVDRLKNFSLPTFKDHYILTAVRH